MADRNPDDTNYPPFETEDLRSNLTKFLIQEFDDPITGKPRAIGGFKWGVYAFFDYDGEPIYVGQTKEKVSTRIRRHLTNQRTDAVAMSVLDPFEVYEVEVWPLPQFQKTGATDPDAKAHLDALEDLVYQEAIAGSTFKAVLNEKDPPAPTMVITKPPSLRFRLVSDDVHKIRSHPDFRIARRALIISRLAQVISERKVQGGLRRVLVTQAKRLQWLTERRYIALGGASSVETEDDENN
ncbi:GIY-YIG nuclease family protein [Primorskyibacter flagellatus]|uniref:GIY-YIG catalytic domain-containing protein n=1 Tax=Primorskyibacter flagellatus TaxID=1387277 RepID=A0A1W1YZZ3_9RHOB|nr:GIY-YIG nuclease family protein [Primorskyibacter flagellatus]SMC41714.1 GIY-YIG catalytic domain-containing protein [Primorskyibacter flagellatus]